MTYLTYHDVLIRPEKSYVLSRKDVETKMEICGHIIDLPVLASNMESVTNVDTLKKLHEAGSCGVLHRFKTDEERIADAVEAEKEGVYPLIVSVGLHDSLDFIEKIIRESLLDIIVLDTAHAHSEQVIEFVKELKELLRIPAYDNISLIAGNIATEEAAEEFINIGVDGLKVGIGSGSACTTRLQTGAGVPMISSIMEVKKAVDRLDPGVTIIADGGINYNGDVGKAIVAGADAVMVGKHFALCSDNTASDVKIPGEKHLVKRYFGSASTQHKDDYVEGQVKTFETHELPTIEDRVKEFRQALQSTVSYAGGKHLRDIKGIQNFIEVSVASLKENNTRL